VSLIKVPWDRRSTLSDVYLVRYINQQLELFESFAQAVAAFPHPTRDAFILAANGEPTLW